MQIITLILSILAVVLGAVALALVLLERKRRRELIFAVNQRFQGMAKNNKKAKEDMLQCAAEGDKRAMAAAEELFKKADARFDKINLVLRAVSRRVTDTQKTAQENKEHIEQLEKGCVPDFEEALRAVNAVNDMNSGIANIFGFDPLEALKQSRQEGD